MCRVLRVMAGLLVCLPLQTVRGDDPAENLAGLIDQHIQARLDAAGVQRVSPSDDAEFLRRVTLDLHGVVPSAQEAARFLQSDHPGKRARLVEDLLASPRFGEYWGDVWRGRLVSPLANDDPRQGQRFAAWMAERFNRNDGWDRIVFDLVTATGKMENNPAVVYLIGGRDPLGVTDLTDLTARYFLGVRLNCAQCHDHPFVDWKQEDYWGMAAFFAQIQTPGRPKLVHRIGVQDNRQITLATLQEADALDGFQPNPPTFLGGAPLGSASTEAHRVTLARWMTAPENPYFARAMVNRLWWQFFGRGLVDPVDDMHEENAPSHPELLDLLSRRFVESGFDLKLLCRSILNSRTYQQTSRPGEDADREADLFARMSVKVLTAEQLYDSLVVILGPPGKTRAIDARFGARHEFTAFFAEEGDPDPLRYGRGIPHALRLMNSPQFAGQNLEALAARVAGRSPDDAIEELYLTILARRPTESERQLVREHLQNAKSLATACRELAWALLMSSEFSLNR